ncbi:ABC transporter permease [Spirosoma aerolatum]|uniref:ABC transporter permease n=1 Tax=Spirosoma aerolatum TaxID=1211326 RepID=UPI0009AEE5CD|nr:ABC transporter permease [Spirosoma aerolatum]
MHQAPRPMPPELADKLLRFFLADDRLEEVLGDLHEDYRWQVNRVGERRARWRYWWDAIGFLKPWTLKRTINKYPTPTNTTMLRNYLKIAWRNLIREKGYSTINIVGLSVGMGVAMLIGLWIYDELSFNKSHQHYDRIAQVMENQTLEQGIQTYGALPLPLSQELRTQYASDFKAVAATTEFEQIITYQDKKFTRFGNFAEADYPEILTLRMLSGNRQALRDPGSVLLAKSTALALFGNSNPLHKLVKVGNRYTLQVAGVFDDLPHNTSFKNVTFIAPIKLLFESSEDMDNWRSSSFAIFTQLNPGSDFGHVSQKIKDVFRKHTQDKAQSSLFLYPMADWHLYSEFKNGAYAGGRIQFVWLFGCIGLFVLLLACINFMNLSTARSEKRAKEVGIRKAIGSMRSQLIGQFFSESFLFVATAFALSVVLVQLVLPTFNEVADKQLIILWTNPIFWVACLSFSLLTGFLAGSYPAFYLSSFQPIKVLKGGAFRVGRFASLPRKVLVVVQFTVSVTLIIGTIVVFRQIQFAQNRPVGYSRNGLINITMNTPEIQGRYDALRNELLATGAVSDMAESSSPITNIWSSANNLEWRGKDPNRPAAFGTIAITPEFGNVVQWKVKEGRSFSRQFSSDSLAFLFNEAAVKLTGLKNRNGGPPVGETIRWHGKDWKLIGIVKDMVMTSPFEPVTPTVFMMNTNERSLNVIHIKLNPVLSAHDALSKLEPVFKKFNPASPFEYKFADEEYAKKFAAEQRIGQLASFFAALAILISCLGLFGLASFVAEQRTKEIGVRKVLGASVFNLWGLLSKDFVTLVLISCLLSTPITWYLLTNWLDNYEYRTELSWWIFGVASLGALAITLLTVSFQSIKAALINPVKSLRSE